MEKNIILKRANANQAELSRLSCMCLDVNSNKDMVSVDKLFDTQGFSREMFGANWEARLKQMMTAKDEALLKTVRQRVAQGFIIRDIEQCRVFLLFGPIHEIMDYVVSHSLSLPSASQKFLLLRGNAELVCWYLISYDFIHDVNCRILAECYDDDTILFYTGRCDYNTKLTEELLRVRRFALLEKIQEQHSLYSTMDPRIFRAHVKVILRAGHPELLKTQIRRYGLREDDVCLLLDSGNQEIIRYYLEYYELEAIGQQALVGSRNAAVVQYYQERYGFLKGIRKQAEKFGLLKTRKLRFSCFGWM